MTQLGFLIRQLRYDLDTGLLFRPAMLLLVYAALGLIMPYAEARLDLEVRALATEPGTASALLTTLASAIMTVVSMVYSILLVALSLISMQFSTRILGAFMRDSLNRTVLGLFVGTFTYCLLVLRAVRSDPPWVPEVSVGLAMVLCVICLGSLVLFIHHIVRNIQANVLVDRLASEAELILREVFPASAVTEAPAGPTPAFPVYATSSGYIQLFDIEGLAALARGRRIHVTRPMGAFVAAGVPLFYVSEAPDEALRAALMARVDIGPQRTLQGDAEFGLRQIVDIALKALSPAVNDPSTAATCVDHLGRLLVLAASRYRPQTTWTVEGGLLHVPSTCLLQLLDLAYDQIRQYGRSDMAITLRLLRALADLAPVVRDEAVSRRIHQQAGLMVRAAEATFAEEDRGELDRRYAALIGACPLPGTPTATS